MKKFSLLFTLISIFCFVAVTGLQAQTATTKENAPVEKKTIVAQEPVKVQSAAVGQSENSSMSKSGAASKCKFKNDPNHKCSEACKAGKANCPPGCCKGGKNIHKCAAVEGSERKCSHSDMSPGKK